MKQLLIIISLCFVTVISWSQNQNKSYYKSFAVYNTQNAFPFGKFAGLFKEILHPGIEFGVGKNFSTRQHHDFFAELKAGYFFHRFVQHGIPVYLNFGYRYKTFKGLAAETSLGAGYLHSIPATAKFKLDDDGVYKNNKGIGRMQAMATFTIDLGYTLNRTGSKPVRIFSNYQQRLQLPFVKSYVPLLPYNSFMVGISRPFRKQ
jgi:hypothetical protein